MWVSGASYITYTISSGMGKEQGDKREFLGPYFTNSRSGSKSPLRAATKETVVLSPPGMIKASHFSNCGGVRTSMNDQIFPSLRLTRLEADCKSLTCSMKEP